VRRTRRGGSGTGRGHVAQAELLKLQKIGQFPDEPASAMARYVTVLEALEAQR